MGTGSAIEENPYAQISEKLTMCVNSTIYRIYKLTIALTIRLTYTGSFRWVQSVVESSTNLGFLSSTSREASSISSSN